ncbi:MAG TPA: metal/formaldehyde-sensitive transcriptional repressor [Aurantimonas coralicida]|uniref:Metal/formaldehyde-sensitive transcriptional repressor n=2 Tax=root TaxID=1 RepID=A0A9C9TGC1_9HYPH|nr:metal/formaldehyde-sensitive transcriptional repressor [Aurantimonas coralicida]HET99552.1 metal/formaldehyde-sensitive transcriptional repressor [Aurantimonas coralicida]
MAHTSSNKDQLIARIRRIAGQMAAVERALDTDAGCSAVLQQVAAARGAINGLMDELIEDHLREHVARPDIDDAARAAGADELIAVIRRYAK